jgi:hypothetical protein
MKVTGTGFALQHIEAAMPQPEGPYNEDLPAHAVGWRTFHGDPLDLPAR